MQYTVSIKGRTITKTCISCHYEMLQVEKPLDNEVHKVDGVYNVEVRIIGGVRAVRRQKVCHGLSLISPDRSGLDWYLNHKECIIAQTCTIKQYIKYLLILPLPLYHILQLFILLQM